MLALSAAQAETVCGAVLRHVQRIRPAAALFAYAKDVALTGKEVVDAVTPSWKSRPRADFDFENVDRLTALLVARLQAGAALGEAERAEAQRSPLDFKLALLQATATSQKSKPMQDVVRALRATEGKQQKRLIAALAAWNLDKPDALDAADLADHLYDTYDRNRHTWLSSRFSPSSMRSLIERKAVTEVLREDLEQSLPALGIRPHDWIAERGQRLAEERPQANDLAINRAVNTILLYGMGLPEELRGRLRLWLHDHPNTEQWTTATLLNAFSMKMFGVPISIPRAAFLYARPLSRAQRENLREKGFDATYPDLKEVLGGPGRFDEIWNFTRAGIYFAVQIAGGAYFVSHWDQMKMVLDPRTWIFLYSFSHVTKEDLKKKEDETFDADRVRREQFESFKEAYNLMEGPFDQPLPNPWDADFEEKCRTLPPGYRVEALTTWQKLLMTPPDKLRGIH